MKKKFLKNLAFALAAATVITAAGPAAASNAAAAPSFNQKAKNLYLNNDAVGKSFDFNIKNKVKGSTYKWSSSNTAVATVNNKNGVVTGKKVGTVKITCKITLPTKKTKTLTATVNVKKNATAVAISNVPADNTIGIGEKAYNFNRSITDKDATDKTYWIIDSESNTAGATVNTANGVVSTTKPGEFKITAYTYQNNNELKAKNWTSTGETVTIKVVPTLKEAKQSTLNKVAATFDTDMSKIVTKDNITLADANGVKLYVKEVSFSDDGKQVTVESYSELVDKAVYKLTYSEKTVEFTASKGDVVSIAVVPKTVQYNTDTKFDVQLFDANGVDVTTKEKLGDVSFEYDKSLAYIKDLGSDDKHKIYMNNYDSTVSVKATYHTYKYVNNEEVKYESPAVTFTAVKEIKDQASSIEHTIVKGNPNWSKPNKIISANAGYTLHLKAKDKNGDDIDMDKFDYESTDPNVVTVYKSGNTVTVYGIKAGTAYIKATYGSTFKMLDVTVGAESKLTSVEADVSYVKLFGVKKSQDSYKDTMTVKVTAKDQYGEEIAIGANDITPTWKSGNGEAIVTGVAKGNIVTFTLDPSIMDNTTSGNKVGNNTFELSVKGEKSTKVTVEVEEVTNTTVDTYRFEKASATINSDIEETKDLAKAEFRLAEVNNKNQRIGIFTNVVEATGIVTKFENKDIKTSDKTNAKVTFNNTDGILTFTAGEKTDDDFVPAANGFYEIIVTSTTDKVERRATVNVVNKDLVPTAERKADKVSASTVNDVIKEGLKIKLNGTDIFKEGVIISVEGIAHGKEFNTADATKPAPTSIDIGSSVRINKIVFKRTFDTNKSITQTIDLKGGENFITK